MTPSIFILIRASVDALCRDGTRTTRPPYSPGNNNLSLKNTPLGSIDSPLPQTMPFRLIGIFAFRLGQFFHTRFSDFSVIIIFFFFIFFLSHRPSALRKRGKGLIFTPNISTGNGGVHRHHAIVHFLLYDTTTNHEAFNFTSLNNAILQLPRLSVYALYASIIALIASVVASRRLSNFSLPQLQRLW